MQDTSCILKLFSKNQNAVVYSFLISQNVLSICVSKFVKMRKVVWGNRISNFPDGEFGWKGDVSFFLEKKLSSGVDLIISNSRTGKNIINKRGLKPKNNTVIRNGIDTDNYFKDISYCR